MEKTKTAFTGYQKSVVAILAFLQFTIILDFMIMSPLGATVMTALQVTPSQFGLVVSAYAFSAGISGVLAAGFADRFDRKRMLLFFYVGFILGTLLCAVATSFPFLLFARIVTGFFGGVIGSIVLAITADLFTLQMRGRVMGVVQTAFAASQILGLPIGLYISNLWGWHAPFLMIVIVATLVGGVILVQLRPVDAHLKSAPDRNAFHHLWITVTTRSYILAFATTALLGLGGYLLMPFGSAFAVHNLGIELTRLPIIYLISGCSAIFIGPLVGKASDSFGKYNTFLFGAAVSIVMVLIYTNLGVTPLPLVALVMSVMFVGIFSRMIPAQALMSAIPDPSNRGSFMAVNSSLQQVSGGLASIVAGVIVVESSIGRLENINVLGYILVATVLITSVMMWFIHRSVPESRKL